MVLAARYTLPPRIECGIGCRHQVAAEAKSQAHRWGVVCGSRTLLTNGTVDELLHELTAQGVQATLFTAPSNEPTFSDVDQLVTQLRSSSFQPCDGLIAVGGGSTLDITKAAAGLITQPGKASVLDYLEGVGTGAKLVATPARWIALPTTAGTGSEATRNAVISGSKAVTASNGQTEVLPFKKSLRHENLLPCAVFLDPELQCSLPPQVTAWSGFDALVQLIESATSCRATPLTQAFSERGWELGAHALATAYREPHNLHARSDMSQAALFSGLALANGGLGIAHGVAASLGMMAGTPHGLACALLLPLAMNLNATVALPAMARLGRAISNRATTLIAAEEAVRDHLQNLIVELKIPTQLRSTGLAFQQIPQLVQGSHGNSREANARPITDSELQAALEAMW